MSPKYALAATLGLDLSELSEYRYKETRTIKAIYSIGDYWCASSTIPNDQVGGPWEKHDDQFWAERANTIIWRANTIIGAN
jgi:hypothetical protein